MGRKSLKGIIVLLVLIGGISANSQHKHAFSLGAYGGICLPSRFVSGYDNPKMGYNFLLDAEARTYNFSFFFNTAYNVFPPSSGTLYDVNTEILEVSAGPRWIIGKRIFYGTFELGLAFYKYHSNGGWGDGNMGLNSGLGLNYGLTDKSDISLKGKYHLMGFGLPFTPFGTVYLGIRYYIKR